MAFKKHNSKCGLQSRTSGQISSRLDLTYALSTITSQKSTECKLDLLFEAMHDDYIGGQPSATSRTTPAAPAPQVLLNPTASTTIADTVPTPTNSSSQAANIPNTPQDVDKLKLQQQHVQQQDNQSSLQPKIVADNFPSVMFDGDVFENLFSPPSKSATESSYLQYVDPSNITLKEDVYVCQPEGFIDADHPIHVYKLKKALYRLKQAPRTWCDKLSTFLLQNHFFKGTIDPTLFKRRFDDDILVIKDKINLDPNGILVDAMKYRSMIGALMYLTSSRLDIVHATCLGARYQAKPIEKHLKEVKRIFCYLWGSVNTGLWYTKDSCFELTGCLDVDYAGCKDTFNTIAISCNPVQHSRTKHIDVRYYFINEHVKKGTIKLCFVKMDYQLADLFTKALPVDRLNYLVRRLDADYAGCKDTFKNTFGRAQLLGEKLVSWSLKKQDCTALSTTEAEYVSLSACCTQVLWMRTQLTDDGFHFKKIPIYYDSKSSIAISCNPLQHSRTKHIAKMEEINNFQQEPDESLFRACKRFKELLMKYPQHYLTDMQEVILFYNGLDVQTQQILDLKDAIPSKTAADAKVAI
nr:uncharacterized mitochondrial protein AtMg00810-like [Tanacetum cinerariifolium]